MKREVKPTRWTDLGGSLQLAIYPDNTAGGRKLPKMEVESCKRLAREDLQRLREKVLLIEEWLTLPDGIWEQFT